MKFYLQISVALLLGLFGCAHNSYTISRDEIIQCKGTIIATHEKTMEVLFDAGGAWYDATVFRLESPAEFLDKELIVYTSGKSPDSDWKTVGKAFLFSIPRKYIMGKYIEADGSKTEYSAHNGDIEMLGGLTQVDETGIIK